MPGGRPRKPDDLKIADGTWRKDRDGDPSKKIPATGDPVCPKHVRGEALAFWKANVPGLIASGVAKACDAPELAMMCEWHARYQKFSRVLGRMKGTDKRLYQVTVMLGIATQNFDKIAARFGLTPADRAKLRIDAGKRTSAVPSRKRG
jgi:phage terminase small subunit